jgi:hypothetical protein
LVLYFSRLSVEMLPMQIENFIKLHKHDQWSFVDYSEGYASKFDCSDGSKLKQRINEMRLEDPQSEYDLYYMSWRGPVDAEVFEYDDYYEGW